MARRSSGPRLASGQIPDEYRGEMAYLLFHAWLGSPEQMERDYPTGGVYELVSRPDWLDEIVPCEPGEWRDMAVSGEIEVP